MKLKMLLLLATSNAGKVREFRHLLSGEFAVVGTGDPPYSKQTPPEVPELSETYYEHALAKAMAYWRAYRVPVLSDDSGLEVDVLDGAPGVHSAVYGGASLSWMQRWKKLHEALATYPVARWTCRFRAVLCYYDGKGPPRFFEGVCEGSIVAKPSGGKGFGYDPIVRSTELQKTFGDATDEEKSHVSHRARASAAFIHWWQTRT